MITKENILHALSHVEEPDLKKDLVTLKMIDNIEILPDRIKFDVILTTPACPLKGHIEHACRNAIAYFVSKDIEVEINMTSRVVATETNQLKGIKNIVLVSSGEGGVGKETKHLNGIKYIVSVTDGKGGVGKASVVSYLALALAETGANPGLVDADIYGPCLPLMFALEGAKPAATQGAGGKTRIEP